MYKSVSFCSFITLCHYHLYLTQNISSTPKETSHLFITPSLPPPRPWLPLFCFLSQWSILNILYKYIQKKMTFCVWLLNMEWPSWGPSQYFIPLYAWAMFYSVNTKHFVYHTLWINVDRHLGGFIFYSCEQAFMCKKTTKKSVRCC